ARARSHGVDERRARRAAEPAAGSGGVERPGVELRSRHSASYGEDQAAAVGAMRRPGRHSSHSAIDMLSRFHASPVAKAARYEPVRSKIAPDIQPPSAMPSSVAISTMPTRVPASCGEKYSRTMMA